MTVGSGEALALIVAAHSWSSLRAAQGRTIHNLILEGEIEAPSSLTA